MQSAFPHFSAIAKRT